MSFRQEDYNNEEWAASPFRPPPPPTPASTPSKKDIFGSAKSPKKSFKKAFSSLKVSDDRAMLLSPHKSKGGKSFSVAVGVGSSSGGGLMSSSSKAKKEKESETLQLQQQQQQSDFDVNMSLFDSRMDHTAAGSVTPAALSIPSPAMSMSAAATTGDASDERDGASRKSGKVKKLKKKSKSQLNGLISPTAAAVSTGITPATPVATTPMRQSSVGDFRSEVTEDENLNTIKQLFAESSKRNNGNSNTMHLTPPRQPPTVDPKAVSMAMSGSANTSPTNAGASTPAVKQYRNIMNMGKFNIPGATDMNDPFQNMQNGADGKAGNRSEFVLRSSELEPYPHQVQIPSADQFLFHAKLCEMMDKYCQLVASYPADVFDFNGAFAGLSRFELQMLYQRKMAQLRRPMTVVAPHQHGLLAPNAFPHLLGVTPSGSSSPTNNGASGSHSSQQHHFSFPLQQVSSRGADDVDPDILASLLQCADDVVVEGRLHGHRGSSNTNDLGVEVTVFSSHSKRQCVACYRGTPDQQAKPFGHKKHDAAVMVPLHSTAHPNVMIQPNIRDSYYTQNLEGDVFRLLNRALERDPFCDVVMCGHSFGGALACMAAVRFADMYPMRTVSCHAFGAVPRIGGMPFRHLANSMPNLKVMRIEYGNDEYNSRIAPTDHHQSNKLLFHAGHTVCILPGTDEDQADATQTSASSTTTSTVPPPPPPSPSPAMATPTKVNLTNRATGALSVVTANHAPTTPPPASLKALAYRFDDKRPIKQPYSSWSAKLMTTSAITKKEKKDHDISSYTMALQLFHSAGTNASISGKYAWATRFVGEEGQGINGLNNEERLVV